MDLTQIEYFLEAAESQHITNSAKKLHIAQPALTRSIHKFEQELGVPLFTRKGRNIILNENGRYLKRKLEPIIAELEAVPELLRTKAKLENETIHLNVLAASTLITEAIIGYKTLNENINFQLFQNGEDELYDICVTTRLSGAAERDNVKGENAFVLTEEIYLAVPDRGKYRDMTKIRLEEVKDEGFISLVGSKQLRHICDELCQKEGFRPKIIFESDNISAVKNMIAANIGIGFWPERTWGSLEGDKVKLLEIEAPECRREIVITCNYNKTDNTNVRSFFEFLSGYAQSQLKME